MFKHRPREYGEYPSLAEGLTRDFAQFFLWLGVVLVPILVLWLVLR